MALQPLTRTRAQAARASRPGALKLFKGRTSTWVNKAPTCGTVTLNIPSALIGSEAFSSTFLPSLPEFDPACPLACRPGSVLPAHRAVLVARCDVMAAMFSGKYAEARSRVVPIHGVSSDTFLSFLEYLYTDSCCPGESSASSTPTTPRGAAKSSRNLYVDAFKLIN